MDERLDRIASMANQIAYEGRDLDEYIDGAPHIKHESLRELYGRLVLEVFDAAKESTDSPVVADLGAGEGGVTLPFLELGAQVVAVDISSSQLAALKSKAQGRSDQLDARCQDIHDFLKEEDASYDIVAVNAFLHHIPDYLSLIRRAVSLLKPGGVFFSFQDPLRYDTVGFANRALTDTGYFFWRLSGGAKGDVLGGIYRRARRKFGVYHDDSKSDNAEYHVVRNGVDQEAIANLLVELGCECRVVRYYSSQNTLFQKLGEKLGLENVFGVVAKRPR
ncbi:Ubiquinone biosynthesis O-methyltransferase [Posidoniimonas corsicana]|uniref:Ubiquinone biosynthesis O-methyltransferase n=1 Tax=Posidoniimonas corsicana TaxID=1938618 RepID=A0A5C5UYW6_9BACT|nr:class I SAM-dependent methyltransferase [Posidoniimonas corsicana]TWT31328.1 Ubiquinone biosynthesis O-methyltransferase [Posidoniimonas corsicana]